MNTKEDVMDTAAMIKTLQDPMGVPFFPGVFQALMVLIFALHIIFVNFALGTSFLSTYGYLRRGEYWKRLSKSMVRATTANLSMAILLGIAPLLFVQVIYDPFWYASNMLSAAWAIGFVFILMLAYSLIYVFYLKRDSGPKQDSRGYGFAVFGITAFALLVLAGAVMHALGYQLLQPEKWLDWYVKGNAVRTAGASLHSFQVPRFLHFIIPSFAMTGIFLMLYAWYFEKRDDMDREYVRWVGKLGARMAFFFTVLQAGIGIWWLLSLPPAFRFFTNPFFMVGAGLGIALLIVLYAARKAPARYAVGSMAGAVLAVVGMSSAREALRMGYLGRFDYSVYHYKLNIDFGSTALFLATFAMGMAIIGYLLSIGYKAGRTSGTYVASASMNTWGRVSIVMLLLWMAAVVGLGIVISIRNYL
jgi:hypothetical protein